MIPTNYYQLLQVPSNASIEEIKRAYRKLAQQYHPDKSGEDKLATAYFRQIKEAYEILSHTKKRQEYNNQRFSTTANQKMITPGTILQDCIELRKITTAIGYYHIDFDLLQAEVEKILVPENILMLRNNSPVKLRIVNELITCCNYLPYIHLEIIKKNLSKLANQEQNLIIQQLIRHKRQWQYWDKHKLLFAIAIALLFCLLMFFAK